MPGPLDVLDHLDRLDDPEPFSPSPELLARARRRGVHLRRRRRLALSAAVMPILLVLALVAGAVYVERRTDQVQRVEVASGLLSPIADGQPFNVLVVGLDGPDRRTDAMVVVHVDRDAGHVTLLPLPRDLVFGDATSGADRLNNAMARGGPDDLIAAVRDDLGLEISHYVAVDFDGFRELVDAAGGISVRADQALVDRPTGLELAAGCQHLDGEQTVALVRARHLEALDDGQLHETLDSNDLIRIADQQVVLRLLFEQVRELGSDPIAMNTMLGVFAEHTTIDAGFDRSAILGLAMWGRSLSTDDITTATLPIVSNVLPDGSAVLRVSNEVRPADLLEPPPDHSTQDVGVTAPTPAITPC